MKESIKQFFYLLDSSARKSLPLLIMAFLISSVLDVIGVGMVGVFLGLLTNPGFLQQQFPTFQSLFAHLTERNLILISGLVIISAFLFKAIITFSIQRRVVYFCQSLSMRMKHNLMAAFQYAPYSYHLQKNSMQLQSVIQSNVDCFINNVLLSVLQLISSFLVALAIIGFLSILHPFMTAFLVMVFIGLGVGYDLFGRRNIIAMGKITASAGGELGKCIQHGLRGLTEIRVFGRERYILNSLDKIAKQYSQALTVLITSQQIPRYLVENTIAIFIIGLSLGCVLAGIPKTDVVALVGMFAAAGARLLPTVNQIMGGINQVRGYSPHMKQVYEELIELQQMPPLPDQQEKLAFAEFALHDVSFEYPKAEMSAIQHLSLTVKKGQSIGLIGPSGAGKSTLINLMLGFLVPQRGSLSVDGQPVTNMRMWLNNFSYIPQSVFLLDDTLRRNIALGIDDAEIDEERLQHAVEMAQLSDVVRHLPAGVDTELGENGVRLSGGQRQRVALARAFYHEREIIVMDEATSSLDHETESEVINTIKRLKGNKTLIVIAHRLTTVEHCDVLYRLEKGRITSMGSFQEVVGVTA